LNVTFSGALNEPIFRRAVAWHMRGLRAIGAVFVVMGLLGLIVNSWLEPLSEWVVMAPALFALQCGGVALWFTPWWAARRQFRSSSLLRAAIHGSANESGIRFNSEYGTSELPWHAFHKARFSAGAVLLYPTAAVFHIVPREFFEDQTSWETFVALVRQQVKKT
jgi:hypothetical protein